ncbi:MAG: CHASE2 domain-containing protein [Campylobacterales bacterium]|nr:CHASE2 domain-containing protein [Campylobacterales bacterium]
MNRKRHIIVISLLLLLYLYFYTGGRKHIEKLDYGFYDFTSQFVGVIDNMGSASYTVIVDIDEKSLQLLGQWPWPRVIDAKLIDMIHAMNPSAIGVNILFSESDRVSPLSIQAFYKNFFDLTLSFREIPDQLKDNDRLLSQSIYDSGATLSIYFNNTPYSAEHCRKLSYQDNRFAKRAIELNATSLLCNHESIQKDVEHFGFINAWSDSDGIFRRIPLFINYQGEVFPSFALATLLSFDQQFKIDDGMDTLLINFSQKKPKVFSAIDILKGTVSPEEIQGKMVIIGSSVVGLNPTYRSADNQKITNSMIHAAAIDNLLNKRFITQPEYYKLLNMLLSFFISVWLMIFFEKKRYLSIALLLLITASISFLWLISFYINGFYISIGYLWMPLLYFLVLISLYHLDTLNQERQEQEKLLIRQSKFASMGEMIALIAHQWRQPLSVINGIVLNIDMDSRKGILNHTQLDKYLTKIEDTTGYLSRTINDFSNFFASDKNIERFYLTDVVTQTLQLIPLEDKIDIHISYNEKENIQIASYRSELLQALLIIINNAVYACRQNLSVTKEGRIAITANIVQKNLLISIKDNGGGIDTKDLKRIFDPYFTTKAKPHGTGLGLYILKLIVEDSMSGKVMVDNQGDGAIFILEIPLT